MSGAEGTPSSKWIHAQLLKSWNRSKSANTPVYRTCPLHSNFMLHIMQYCWNARLFGYTNRNQRQCVNGEGADVSCHVVIVFSQGPVFRDCHLGVQGSQFMCNMIPTFFAQHTTYRHCALVHLTAPVDGACYHCRRQDKEAAEPLHLQAASAAT